METAIQYATQLAAILKQNQIDYMGDVEQGRSASKIRKSNIEETIASKLCQLPVDYLREELKYIPRVQLIGKRYFAVAPLLRCIDHLKDGVIAKEAAALSFMGGLGNEQVTEEKLKVGKHLWSMSDTYDTIGCPRNPTLIRQTIAYYLASHHTLQELEDFRGYQSHCSRHSKSGKQLAEIVREAVGEALWPNDNFFTRQQNE